MLQAGCAPGYGIWCVWPVCTYTQAAMVSNRHTQPDCNGYFYTVEKDTHTHASFKRTHLGRQTFHTNKRALWTWHHTASLSAGKSIWTSSRPSTPPWPHLKLTLSTCCQMPLSKSKRTWLELDGCGLLRFPCRFHVVFRMSTHCHNTWCLNGVCLKYCWTLWIEISLGLNKSLRTGTKKLGWVGYLSRYLQKWHKLTEPTRHWKAFTDDSFCALLSFQSAANLKKFQQFTVSHCQSKISSYFRWSETVDIEQMV